MKFKKAFMSLGLVELFWDLALGIAPGQLLPDFQLVDPRGNLVTPQNMPKPAVIVFWASWCPFCKAEFPTLHEVAKRVSVPFYVISLEPRDTPQVVLEYTKAYPRFVPLFASKTDTPFRVAERFEVLGTPWTLVVDKEGKVVALFAGRAGKETLLDALLLAGVEVE